MKDKLLELISPYGQQHLLTFWDDLAPWQRESLAAEIGQLPFSQIRDLHERVSPTERHDVAPERVGPPPLFRLGDPANRFSVEEARTFGEASLRAGRVAVNLVAGGQGTRLGFPGPKGTFPIGPVSGASLFQILLEKVLATSRRYGKPVPLYLMTSPATHQATVEFMAEHGRFGLSADDVTIYSQGTMPVVDAATGRILLALPHQTARAPDGHGGMVEALERNGCLADMRKRGIRHLFHIQVDNPLIDVCEPEFLGYHLLSDSEMSTQVVAKQTPFDKVGNVVQIGDRLHVIEYSDLPEEVATRREADGSLVIRAGSIGVHVFDITLLLRIASSPDGLPFHAALKKAPHVDANGREVEPETPNGLKFERFIFDLMPEARKSIAVEVDAATHFAPVKNASPAEDAPRREEARGKSTSSGDRAAKLADTPEWVQRQIVALSANWLHRAGAKVDADMAVEISPLFALDSRELARKIEPGTRVDKPTYFH